jgi:hypothetical protein
MNSKGKDTDWAKDLIRTRIMKIEGIYEEREINNIADLLQFY